MSTQPSSPSPRLPPWATGIGAALAISTLTALGGWMIGSYRAAAVWDLRLDGIEDRMGQQDRETGDLRLAVDRLRASQQEARVETLTRVQTAQDRLVAKLESTEVARIRRDQILNDRIAHLAGVLGMMVERTDDPAHDRRRAPPVPPLGEEYRLPGPAPEGR